MIIITGASDGLGAAIASLLVNNGKKVLNISRSANSATSNILVDFTDKQAIQSAVDEISASNDTIEVFIHNAGMYSEEGMGNISRESLDNLMEVNVKAGILLTSGLLQRFKRDGTDIVNVISTAALKGNQNHSAYAATKWAQSGFAEALQNELKNTPSRVINVFPGGMKTGLFEKATVVDTTENGEKWLSPDDVASLIVGTIMLPKEMEVSKIVINRKKA